MTTINAEMQKYASNNYSIANKLDHSIRRIS